MLFFNKKQMFIFYRTNSKPLIHHTGPSQPGPNLLLHKFAEIPELKNAFEALTPGRQRAYIFHFSQPKQSKTRVSRIEKAMERILNGKGLNDCICGLSQKMPNCDGSHKFAGKK